MGRARHPDVSHRRSGELGNRRAIAVSGARGRAGQDSWAPHRTWRNPIGYGGAGGSRSGRGDRPRGPTRRQAAGRLLHRNCRSRGTAGRAGGPAAVLYGAGGAGGVAASSPDGQWKTRRGRPACAGVSISRSVSRSDESERRNPGRHLRPGTGAGPGGYGRFILRSGWRFVVGDASRRCPQPVHGRGPGGTRRVRRSDRCTTDAPHRRWRTHAGAIDRR
ncbi:Uncharacterised protein [Mycobacteroides abscessus subsp. massiliense]|nr:Uncharacterised protein [Mycobacteroides abscessus subsp. massiliense]SKU48014.1 Uncharacterised protein [Mycobacteroides abscessus subsp. massiliense]SKU71215.1 Uncharacterised protein [Mycobacteroides abscessus subsp. massiliense]